MKRSSQKGEKGKKREEDHRNAKKNGTQPHRKKAEVKTDVRVKKTFKLGLIGEERKPRKVTRRGAFLQ